MALSDTARLIASLELQDKFSKNAALFDRTVSGMERRTAAFDKLGNDIGRGLRSTTQNLARIGVVGAGLLTLAVTNGVHELERLELAQGQTNAVIESTQGVAGQTADSIRNLAEKYEGLNATIDDKVIQSGENLLLTFTSINKKAFEPALVAALNLNTALGGGEEGLQNTIIQVGKALQDPIRGLTNLRRVGVNFSEQQKKQIKDLVAQNDLYGAQQIILAELTTEFGGSFAAAGDSAAGKFAKVKDAIEDGEAALATGFLPVLVKVSDKLGTFLADPAVIARIESFGTDLAGGFDRLLDVGGSLPWQQIGDAFKIVGTGSKALLDAFLGLPPWVQTAVLTGWGLNKLTGGALTNIVGDIGKIAFGGGLLGRGSSPANPLWVQSVGGGVGGPGGPGGLPVVAGGGALLTALTVGTIGAIATAFVASQLVRQDPFSHEGDVITPGRGFGRFDEHALRDDLSDAVTPLVSEFKKSRATSDQLRTLYAANTAQARLTAQRTSDIARYGQAALGPLGTIAAKDTSVSVSTVVNVTNSATQITQSIRRLLTANATRLTDAGVGL